MKNQDLIKEMRSLILHLKDQQIIEAQQQLRAILLEEPDKLKFWEGEIIKTQEKIKLVESKMKALENEG